MFPLTGRYDRIHKQDNSAIKQHQPFGYNLPMDHNNTISRQQLNKNQLQLDDKYFLLNIIKAHEETCDYTKDKVTSLIEKSRKNPIYARCSTSMSCPLNPLPPVSSAGGSTSNNMANGGTGSAGSGLEDFSERFSPAIRGVVEFAKRIPGFSLLSQDDQVTLLKAGVFEVLLVRLACVFDTVSDSMICLNGMVLQRESLHPQTAARLLIDSMFEFTERLNGLNLTDSEIALFCAIVVISPDRPGLNNIDLVDKINRKCIDLLNQSIKANHHSTNSGLLFNSLFAKIADLRTLNQLHSEKLLAYKMGPQNGQNYNNLSSSSPSSSPISSSSSSSSSFSSLNHHNGNSSDSSSNGDRNCSSPGNMNNNKSSTCSYASMLPVQWQNFTIRDTNDRPPPSSTTTTSRLANINNTNSSSSPHGLGDDESLSFDRNSVTSSDHILINKSCRSAKGLSNNNDNNYSNGDYHYHHHHHHGHNKQQLQNNNTNSSSIANHFILGQRLLQPSTNTNHSSSNSNDCNNNINSNNKNNISSLESPISSINHHPHHHHQQHHHHHQQQQANYDGYCKNSGTIDVYNTKMRRVDSPTDSGIESGKEQCNGSTPSASVCSSPRSACDDKVKDIVSDSECSTISEKNSVTTVTDSSIDDMPMLKRALQAPPLINTNMLMDEAYRHHKKFRATKASRDCEPASSSTSIVHSSNGNTNNPINNNNNNNNNNHCLASPTSTSSSLSSLSSSSSSSLSSSTTSLSSSSPSNHSVSNCDSLASTHSTLIKVLESAPRYIGNLSHNQPVTYRHSSSLSPSYNNNRNNNNYYTPMKKCDLLHSLIMKGNTNNGSANNTDIEIGSPHNNGTGAVDVRVPDSMPPPLDLSRKRDLLYL